MKLLNLFKIDVDFQKRIYGLDILRALAILFVVFTHGNLLLPRDSFIRNISRYLLLDGVSIFFVLSGFLIGGILIKILENKKANFKTLFNFWMRRWLRTIPNYVFVLFLLVVILPFIYNGHLADGLYGKIKYLFFIQNVYTVHPYFFPEAWSLSIEEWFYLLIPISLFVLVGVFRFKPKVSVILVSITILILVTYFRYSRFLETPIMTSIDWDNLFRKQVITRLDSIMYGVIGAYLAYYYKKVWSKYKIILLVIGVLIFFIQKNDFLFLNSDRIGIYWTVFSFSVTSLATLLVIPFLSEFKIGKGVFYRTITFISLISYSMYLINLSVVIKYILRYLPESLKNYTYLNYFCYWAITIIGSGLLYKFIELPFMKLREHITK